MGVFDNKACKTAKEIKDAQITEIMNLAAGLSKAHIKEDFVRKMHIVDRSILLESLELEAGSKYKEYV